MTKPRQVKLPKYIEVGGIQYYEAKGKKNEENDQLYKCPGCFLLTERKIRKRYEAMCT